MLPTFLYCCAVAGVLLIAAEFCLPGRVVPGAVGATLVLGSAWKLTAYHPQPVALVLGIAGAGLLLPAITGRFTIALGLLSAGFLCAASAFLLAAPSAVHPAAAVGGAIAITAVLLPLGRVASVAHRKKQRPDAYDRAP